MGMMRSFILMAFMTALLLVAGYAMGGEGGLLFALIFAGFGNMISWWYSDKIVLRLYNAVEVGPQNADRLYRLTRQLAQRADLPMPKVYVIQQAQPNAFATGRNPQNAAVAATTGLMQMLNDEELAGVMAHELAHVKNRDTLTMTLTATIAGALSMLANMMMFRAMFGGNREQGGSGALGLLMMFVAPLAASLVQMAISRTREYEADRIGAEICGNPLALASALHKIQHGVTRAHNVTAEDNPATAHMFIINPLFGRGSDNLFSTHPDTNNRIKALQEMAQSGAPQAQHPGVKQRRTTAPARQAPQVAAKPVRRRKSGGSVPSTCKITPKNKGPWG